MSDTARNYQTFQPAATEGLEDLFVYELTRTDADLDRSDRADAPDSQLDDNVYWTPQMAAVHFGVTERTIRRRLKDGLLRGRKVAGTNGPEWRIDPVADMDVDTDRLDGSDRSDIDADASVIKSQRPPLDQMFEYLREKDQLLEQKDKDLQAASATIGYLRRQIEDQDKQLKLVTDREYQRTGWQRFRSWFFGLARYG